jgi:hypothetical protein
VAKAAQTSPKSLLWCQVGEEAGDERVDSSIIIRSVVRNEITNSILETVFLNHLFYDLCLVLT